MSQIVIIVFFVCIFTTHVYAGWLFKRNPIYTKRHWRRYLLLTYIVNMVSFFSIAMLFYLTYGYITDDKGYFRNSFSYKAGFFESSGSSFMWYVTRPLTTIFFFDLPSCHVLFGTLGYIGSLNFLFILSKRIVLDSKELFKKNKLKIFSMMCFPNFMAWGRFFGKDSSMFFLASIYLYNSFVLLSSKKIKKINVFGIFISTLIMYKIRPHIAGVALISLSIGIIMRLYEKSSSFRPNVQVLYRLFIPLVILGIASGFTAKTVMDMSNDEKMSVESVQGTIVSAAKMGSYGGSSTSLDQKLKTDPTVLFRPHQMSLNIINLYLSPYPWQVRGGADMIAFFSNIFLIWLVFKFRKDITLEGIFQKYLLIMIVLLTVLISFMSGNVGLILRQKTVILPFILLFVFHKKSDDALINKF